MRSFLEREIVCVCVCVCVSVREKYIFNLFKVFSSCYSCQIITFEKEEKEKSVCGLWTFFCKSALSLLPLWGTQIWWIDRKPAIWLCVYSLQVHPMHELAPAGKHAGACSTNCQSAGLAEEQSTFPSLRQTVRMESEKGSFEEVERRHQFDDMSSKENKF